MGLWNLYFIGKLILHCAGSIALNPWLNLCLAVVLLLPPQRPLWRRLCQGAAIGAAVVLLYHESFLPPLRSLLREASGLSGFSFGYLLEIAGRLFDPVLTLWLLALASVCVLLRQWLRISALVLVALVLVPLIPLVRLGSDAGASGVTAEIAAAASVANSGERLTVASDGPGLDRAVAGFFTDESRRMLLFPGVTRPLDVIFLHICSLAWEDLRAIDQERHPLFSHFDVLYTHFNSAASYSGPAAIRLLRGTCGQPRHDALYDPAQSDCLLMTRLQQAGFTPQLLMNHDGHYGNFREDLERRGGIEVAPLPTAGARIALRAFDGAPIIDDYDLLARWWQQRRALADQRIALYYNTISLHDGNRSLDGNGTWRREYPRRARKLLDDINRFIGDLETSGERAMVVFIPEHGAAFQPGRGQIAGLRQIPGPGITEVPVGVRFVGLRLGDRQRPLRVERSTSYFGLNLLLANVMRAAQDDTAPIDLARILAHPQVTPFVAENDGLLVVRGGDGYRTRGLDGRWSR
ncbi:MAG: cellulose biosynthesis protein BcsG [Gammaproteobacteria bacterium]|nr:cellulose biosynthesis protein BcsG [Gammaproteobacteria bacterium]